MIDPRNKHHEDGFPDQEQEQPGLTEETVPTPDHGEEGYRGSGRLEGKRALITGGDSGIGRAVAIAYAREGADRPGPTWTKITSPSTCNIAGQPSPSM